MAPRKETPEWRYVREPEGQAFSCDWCDLHDTPVTGRSDSAGWYYVTTDGKNRVCSECFEWYCKSLLESSVEAHSSIWGMAWGFPIAEGPPCEEWQDEAVWIRFWACGSDHETTHYRGYAETLIDPTGREIICDWYEGPEPDPDTDAPRRPSVASDRDPHSPWKAAVQAYLQYPARFIRSEAELFDHFPHLDAVLAAREDRADWMDKLIPVPPHPLRPATAADRERLGADEWLAEIAVARAVNAEAPHSLP